ncbi:MAG: hypothetical protein DI538_21570 [Azospira oryzae]|jgi:phosphoenolpyruvate synthase/pyruvate phosphate dikinase|nr:MAG: hypothetical protein DI538_21570 [Azospira oryzae]
MKTPILPFEHLTDRDIAEVGIKNVSLGKLINHMSPLGIRVPDGFAICSDVYFDFLNFNSLSPLLQAELNRLNCVTFENAAEVSQRCGELIMQSEFPKTIAHEIKTAYTELVIKHGLYPRVAVRSSGTTDHSPHLDFTGQYATYLNINGTIKLFEAIKKCYASFFNEKALRYRHENYCSDVMAGISIGVQVLVRSDQGSAGISFTLTQGTEEEELIYVRGSWGLGQGELYTETDADEFYLSKAALRKRKPAVVLNIRGLKEKMLALGITNDTQWITTPEQKQKQRVLDDDDLRLLGLWHLAIEKFYQAHVTIEWAKDNENGKLYVLQARVENITHENKVADPSASIHVQPSLSTFREADITRLHKESNAWLQQIQFMADEAFFLQKRLADLPVLLRQDGAQKISEELAYLTEHAIGELNKKIIDHEHFLANTFLTDTPGRQSFFRQTHAELKEELKKYERVFLQLKQHLFSIVKHYDHSKR